MAIGVHAKVGGNLVTIHMMLIVNLGDEILEDHGAVLLGFWIALETSNDLFVVLFVGQRRFVLLQLFFREQGRCEREPLLGEPPLLLSGRNNVLVALEF